MNTAQGSKLQRTRAVLARAAAADAAARLILQARRAGEGLELGRQRERRIRKRATRVREHASAEDVVPGAADGCAKCFATASKQ